MPDASERKAIQLRGRAAADRFVELLTGDAASTVHWRIKQDVIAIARDTKDARHYALNRHGSLAELWDEFEREQANFRSPFMVVNEGGHKAKDITKVRAVFIDMDGGTKLADVQWHVPPHFIVARSASKYHAYWLCDLSLDQFREVQKRLIARYGSDPAIHDLSRVMRVPGFDHLKDAAHPSPVVLADRLADVPGELLFDHRLDYAQVTAGLPALPPIVPREPSEKKGKPARLSIVRDMAACINFDRPHKTPLGELSVRDGWMQCLWAIRDAALNPDLSEEERLELCDDMSSGKLTSERTGKPCDPIEYDGPELVAEYIGQQPTSNAGNPVGIGLIETLARLDGYTGPPLSYESLLDDVDIPSDPSPETADDAAEIKNPNEIAHDEKKDRRRSQFHFKTEAEQVSQKPPPWLLKDVLPRASVVTMLGTDRAFKTFIVLDWEMSIVSGLAWAAWRDANGNVMGGYMPVPRADGQPHVVVHLTGESARGVETLRVPAWRKARGVLVPEGFNRFYTCAALPRLNDRVDVEMFMEELIAQLPHSPDMLTVDTTSRMMRGMDENSASDGGLLVEFADEIASKFDTTVVLIHHLNAQGKRGRGSTVIEDDPAVRFMLKREAGDGSLEVEIRNTKQRDGSEWAEPVVMRGREVQVEKIGADGEVVRVGASLVFDRAKPERSVVAGDPIEIPTVRAVLGREVVKSLRRHPPGTTLVHEHLLEDIMHDRMSEGGSLHGQKATDAQINAHKRELNAALRQAAKPRKRGKIVAPAALGAFLAAPWTPGAVLMWRLPVSAKQADDVPDDVE